MALDPASLPASPLHGPAREPAPGPIVPQALTEPDTLDAASGPPVGALGDPQTRLTRYLASVLTILDGAPAGASPAPHLAEPLPSQQTSRLRVYCLGTFRLVCEGVEVESWRSGKARALFQYLVNHRGHTVPREGLIEALWPDPEVTVPTTSLKVAAHALRHVLLEVDSSQQHVALRTQDTGYQLRATGIWLDVEEFERCCAAARQLEAHGHPTLAADLYARAIELYLGDFLEESWDDWVVFRREGLKDQYLYALARLAQAALNAGDYQGCALHCQRLLEKDRCREDTYRMLMLCHARMGQRGRVRSWYALCVRTLRADLDEPPEAETDRVYRLALKGTL